jgi:fermentation-respiration switch protein FrsA (DUF1100 family)
MPAKRATRRRLLAGGILALAFACAGGSAFAARPARPGTAKGRATAAPPRPIRFLTADSVALDGLWYAAGGTSPIVVLAPRHRGIDEEVRATATEFQKRGFDALTFELRDSAALDRERDSLRYAVLVSHWVDDMVAALHAARARGDSTTHLYAWGQGLGGVLTLSAAARQNGLCDAIAAEDIFATADRAMRERGTSVIPDAVQLQWRVMQGGDEPFSAAARLNLPVLAILDGAQARPADPVYQTFRRNRGHTDLWLRPGVASPAPIPSPAEVDTLVAWFRRWEAFPPARTKGAR